VHLGGSRIREAYVNPTREQCTNDRLSPVH
jgi:hypothetical protein